MVTTASPRSTGPDNPDAQPKRRWVFSGLALFACITALAGLMLGLYPSTAAWFNAREQAKLVDLYDSKIENATPLSAEQLLELAHRYNDRLTVGAALDPWANVPRGAGKEDGDGMAYKDQLRVDRTDVMARIRIPSIKVDLPIYHGTSDNTLKKGAGHLEGTSLPVGGPRTHSVITAHRGLAEATMFTNLNKVGVGDRFTIEVMGEVLTYEVRETRVVSPEDTRFLQTQDDRDLVTLVTCTPLGINTHRILVTAERITPTPQSDIDAARQASQIGFPWWAVIFAVGFSFIALFFWRSGYMIPPKKKEEDIESEADGDEL
ncbi:SpaH fimbrial biogenesis class C sortase SrtD [Corynebacterium diphtheriae]|uniref:Fimbrial associated sortase-like protein n=2 Tax=Corynebacterium diphtheriae TaxID=1717 RepID=Q6NEP3_CORDI|nr:SpaH fimbrial biogenesis class C sortase SrtD [Corynebacterium diphtheriae]ARB88252.1 class C sortase [Corynebacterium diphtheriae]KKA80578.1 fimbrial protein [Corynebacterium diphtheriae]OWM34727.1 sortase [Corynebacterium diphtheriae bv. mitis]OWM46156.1 class C sortase [Corynebacterium diphtheriae]OWM54252.1 class C sortase [Corynebacterium diphtheriae]